MKDIQKFLNILIGADELSHQLQLELRQLIADMKVMATALDELSEEMQKICSAGGFGNHKLDKANSALTLANKYKPLWEESIMEKRVVCAALLDDKGRMIVGARHYDIVMQEMIKVFGGEWNKAEQGFIDQRGCFMSREEAFIVATEAGQIIKKSGDPYSKALFSEDIY